MICWLEGLTSMTQVSGEGPLAACQHGRWDHLARVDGIVGARERVLVMREVARENELRKSHWLSNNLFLWELIQSHKAWLTPASQGGSPWDRIILHHGPPLKGPISSTLAPWRASSQLCICGRQTNPNYHSAKAAYRQFCRTVASWGPVSLWGQILCLHFHQCLAKT